MNMTWGIDIIMRNIMNYTLRVSSIAKWRLEWIQYVYEWGKKKVCNTVSVVKHSGRRPLGRCMDGNVVHSNETRKFLMMPSLLSIGNVANAINLKFIFILAVIL